MTGDACPSPSLSFVIKIIYVLASLEFPLKSGAPHQCPARGTSPGKYRNEARHTQERAIALSAGALMPRPGDAELNRSVLFTQIYTGVDLVHSTGEEWNPRVQRPPHCPRPVSGKPTHPWTLLSTYCVLTESSCHCPRLQLPMHAPAATGQELRGRERGNLQAGRLQAMISGHERTWCVCIGTSRL